MAAHILADVRPSTRGNDEARRSGTPPARQCRATVRSTRPGVESLPYSSWTHRLEARYGPLPSILATRADYTDDAVDAVSLLERAYESAVARGDGVNRVEIAESLAQMHVEHLQDLHGAIRWLAAFVEELETSPDPGRLTELRRLEAHLRLSATPSPDKVPVLVFHGLP
jgi:hypothetical protein